MAQIQLTEMELYKERAQVNNHQHQLSKSIVPILSFVLIVSTVVFLFRSKNNFKKIINAAMGVGQVVLLNYVKKQASQLIK